MTDPSWVAALGLITGLVVLGTAVVTLWRTTHTARTVQQIEVKVNGRLDTLMARVEQLTVALEGSDTAVPDAPRRRKKNLS